VSLHPRNVVGPECRHPGLPCDIVCLECRGDFDVVDRKTGRRVADVDDDTAMARLLAEFTDVD
jgi:hypothetical protein